MPPNSLRTKVTNDEHTPDGHAFPITRWSLVVAAAAEAEPSLEALCRQYWHPVYAVARRAGHDVENAKDLTQGFFAKMLDKGWLAAADQEKGRFRTFLVTALKRYMVNEWHREHTVKRGGFAEAVPLDTELAERIGVREGLHELSPDALFDRRWASPFVQRHLAELARFHSGPPLPATPKSRQAHLHATWMAIAAALAAVPEIELDARQRASS